MKNNNIGSCFKSLHFNIVLNVKHSFKGVHSKVRYLDFHMCGRKGKSDEEAKRKFSVRISSQTWLQPIAETSETCVFFTNFTNYVVYKTTSNTWIIISSDTHRAAIVLRRHRRRSVMYEWYRRQSEKESNHRNRTSDVWNVQRTRKVTDICQRYNFILHCFY